MTAFADSALGLACNSHNQRTLAASCTIDFVRPAQAGERLIASVTETIAGRPSGLYDTCVETAAVSELVALMRARAATVKGEVVRGAGSLAWRRARPAPGRPAC